ncbi:unnamed protein product [Schistosoma rodhaini]|uniref:BAT2_N domain-containing protein n=1 Tax=Schistosoma mansoni TaxID=6183 RepID=A0A3Q0KCD9_SCHMA|nr:hypothetical protein Smp_012280 [Schistosoma mansoni]CAH8518039.1 unnamed protein product [Schistosoma rodhaini]|eukprot:XP_018650110.1 hypothetical protein Smp_012280 [Schistosoma mansoni]
MSLNDFFAKQNKKKSKKKQNPTELMDLLTKGGEVLKSYPESNAPQENKAISSEKDDEWEIIDDEKEIDLQNIRVYNLSSTITDDSAKNLSKTKDSREGDGESVVEKKVWAAKPVEAPEPVEAVVQPPPKPNVYIPAPLRLGGSGCGPVAPKPNVTSSMDFPTLDASVNEPQKKETEPSNDNDDKNVPWQQAGVRRANPVSSALPIAISTATSAYVPPSLRQTGAPGFKSMGPGYTGDGFRPHNDPPFCSDIDPGFKRFTENPGLRETASSAGGWARGNIISVNPTNNPAGHLPPNSSDASFHTVSENTNGWSRNVNVKTYKDVRETPGLEIDLKNRFTAFSET